MLLLFATLGILPFFCLVPTIIYFYFKNESRPPLFSAIIAGSLLWSLLIIVETNLFSFFDCIARGPILAFWSAYFIVIAALLFYIRRRISPRPDFSLKALPIYLIFIFTFIGAIAYAPDFHDSLAYHLPRIMHWLQNKSLAPYVTSIDRQIGMAPFNAMVILQSMAICSDDYFVNLPQWLAFIGCVAGVMRLASQLGANKKTALVSGFFFCTLPIAIMQSGNSESSLIATFWLCVFASAFIAWWKRPNWTDSFSLGASLGLAILSKGIAYPVALPFVALIGWRCLRHFGKYFLYGVLTACLVLAINIPHFYRNYLATDSIVLSAERNIILKPYPALVLTNAVFNFLLQEPWIVALKPKKEWSKLAATIGVDDHNPVYFPWQGVEKARASMTSSDIDGQSPAHTLLIALLLPWLMLKPPKGTGLYIGITALAFLIFFTIITWQPWGARLHLPFFMLCAPLMAIGIERIAWAKARAGILIILGITSFMPLFFCLEHPLGPPAWLSDYRENIMHFSASSRDEQYFNLWRITRKPYIDAANYLAEQKPDSIGVDLSDDGLEYPLWGILNKKMSPLPKIVHTLPPYPADGNGPEYIFKQHHSSFSELPDPVVFKKEGKEYRQVFPKPAS